MCIPIHISLCTDIDRYPSKISPGRSQLGPSSGIEARPLLSLLRGEAPLEVVEAREEPRRPRWAPVGPWEIQAVFMAKMEKNVGNIGKKKKTLEKWRKTWGK